MIYSALTKTQIFSYLEKTSLWKFYLLISLLGTFLTIAFYFPDLDLYAPNKDFYERIDKQIAHPFDADTYTSQGAAGKLNHFNKRVFRLTVPIFAKVFHLNSFHIFILQFLSLPLFFFLLAKLLLQIVKDRISAFFLALSFCFFYPGKSFCFYLPYYDCFAYLLLLSLWLSGTTWLTFLILLLLFFCDERALITSLLVISAKILIESEITQDKSLLTSILKNAKSYATLMALLIYFGLRQVIASLFGLNVEITNANGVGSQIFAQNYSIAPFCFFESLEGWWIIFFLALYYNWMTKKQLDSLFILVSVLTISLIGFSVLDITKSLAYIFALVFFMLHCGFNSIQDIDAKRNMSLLICSVCAFIPTYVVWGGPQSSVYWLSPMFPKILKFIL